MVVPPHEPGVLVRNTGQSINVSYNLVDSAQQFTTGSNAAGYTLSSIGIYLINFDDASTVGSQLTVTLNADDNGNPGDALCTLSDPASFTLNAVNTFDAPTTGTDPCPRLAAGTPYFAVFERVADTDTIDVAVTRSSNEDAAALCWSIGNDTHVLLSNGMWSTTASESYLIEVRGAFAPAFPGHLPAQEFNTLSAAGNNRPRDIWSDGTTMWVVHLPHYPTGDTSSPKLFAYNMSTKQRDSAKDFNTLDAAGNDNPRGLWSDGSTMWVVDQFDEKLYAYDMDTKARVSNEDFKGSLTLADNTTPRGIWAGETTMFVSDLSGSRIFAYWRSTKAPNTARYLSLGGGNNSATGIWSDGSTLWVSGYTDGKIYAYALPAPVPEPVVLVTVDRITANSAVVLVDIQSIPYEFDEDQEQTAVSIDIGLGGATMFIHPEGSTAKFMLRGLEPETEYTAEVRYGATVFLPLDTLTFTTPHVQLGGIKISDLTHTSATVTVSVVGADVDPRGYFNYWVRRDRSDPEYTYYLRYKRDSDGAFSGWSDPVTLTFSGSTDVALSDLDPGTIYDVQVYDSPQFPFTFPSSRPAAFKEGTWLEQFGAFTTPAMPPTLAFEAEMTVRVGINFDGYLSSLGESLSPGNTFEVGGVQYIVDTVGFVRGTINEFELRVQPALPYDSFTLTLGATELLSSSASVAAQPDGSTEYSWSGTNPNWASGATVDVKLDIPLIDICDRSSVVADAIVAATLSYDFCHMTSLLDMDDITEQDLTGKSGYDLKAGDFAGLPNLEILDMSSFHLSGHNWNQLPVGLFDGLDNLIELDLSDTLLQRHSVPVGLFGGLDNLEILRIANAGYLGRGINLLDKDIFRDLGNLRELDVRPSKQLKAAPLSFVPLTSLETYNGGSYTRPVDASKNPEGHHGGLHRRRQLAEEGHPDLGGPGRGERHHRLPDPAHAQRATRHSRYAIQIARVGSNARTYVHGASNGIPPESPNGFAFTYYARWWAVLDSNQ